MCLRRAPEKYIAGAALDRAGLHLHPQDGYRRFVGKNLPLFTRVRASHLREQ
jgi:hypothetical protein